MTAQYPSWINYSSFPVTNPPQDFPKAATPPSSYITTNITTSTSQFAGGVSYVQAEEVLNYLKISEPTQADYDFLAYSMIPMACEYIDNLAGTTWGLKKKVNEFRSLNKPMSAGFYLIGTPLYTQYFPIYPAWHISGSTSNTQLGNTLESLQIWNGITYEEWVGFVWENRNGNYWVDRDNGIVYIIGWWWYMGYEARLSYYYGYNVSGTIAMPMDVKEFALLKSAKLFLDSERYTAIVTQGIGGIEMPNQWNYLNSRLEKLEEYFKGFRTVETGFLA